MPFSVPFDVGWHGISLNCFGHYLWVHPGAHHANLASTGRGGTALGLVTKWRTKNFLVVSGGHPHGNNASMLFQHELHQSLPSIDNAQGATAYIPAAPSLILGY